LDEHQTARMLEQKRAEVEEALKTEESYKAWANKEQAKREEASKAWENEKKAWAVRSEQQKAEDEAEQKEWFKREKARLREALKAKNEHERLQKITDLKTNGIGRRYGLWPETQETGPPFVKNLLRGIDLSQEFAEVRRDVETRLKRTRTVGFVDSNTIAGRMLVLSIYADYLPRWGKDSCGLVSYSKIQEKRIEKQALQDTVSAYIPLPDFTEKSKQKALCYAALYSRQTKWRGVSGVLIEEHCSAAEALPPPGELSGPPYFVKSQDDSHMMYHGDYRYKVAVEIREKSKTTFEELAERFETITIPRLYIFSEFPDEYEARKRYAETWYPEDKKWGRQSLLADGRVKQIEPHITTSVGGLEWSIFSKLWPWWPSPIDKAPEMAAALPKHFIEITSGLKYVKLVKVVKFVPRYPTDGQKEGQWLNEVFSNPVMMDEALFNFQQKYGDDGLAAVDRAIKNFQGPYHPKALENYLASVAAKLGRSSKGHAPQTSVTLDSSGEPVTSLSNHSWSHKSALKNTLEKATQGISVDDAANKLELKDKSNLYRWIREGRIFAKYDEDGRVMIPKEEFEKLAGERIEKLARAGLVKQCMEKRGVGARAARKWVKNRELKGHKLEQIANELGMYPGAD